jgi:hypothetical protein
MRLAVHFHDQPCLVAEEVSNVRTCWMLPPELQPAWPRAQLTPQQNLG